MSLVVGQALRPYSVVAYNYATTSDNKIHDDEVARRFGFAGGLVPGVADYAYLSRPLVDALGRDWLERGRLEVRLRRPVYDGDRVTVSGSVRGLEPLRLALELHDSHGELCATGQAGIAETAAELDLTAYTAAPLPDVDARPEASLDVLPPGAILGTLTLETEARDLYRELPEAFRDRHELYRSDGNEGVLHPGVVPHLANQILVRNVRLGPWIHSASAVQHYATAKRGEPLAVRGRVAAAACERGHDTVILDVVLLGEGERLLAHCLHTAIIRPRQTQPTDD